MVSVYAWRADFKRWWGPRVAQSQQTHETKATEATVSSLRRFGRLDQGSTRGGGRH